MRSANSTKIWYHDALFDIGEASGRLDDRWQGPAWRGDHLAHPFGAEFAASSISRLGEARSACGGLDGNETGGGGTAGDEGCIFAGTFRAQFRAETGAGRASSHFARACGAGRWLGRGDRATPDLQFHAQRRGSSADAGDPSGLATWVRIPGTFRARQPIGGVTGICLRSEAWLPHRVSDQPRHGIACIVDVASARARAQRSDRSGAAGGQ